MTNEPKATPRVSKINEKWLSRYNDNGGALSTTEQDDAYTELHTEAESLERELLAERQNVERMEKNSRVLREALEEANKGRCYACGWMLSKSANQGCTPLNCSYRPSEHHQSHLRWKIRQTELHAALAKETT